MPESNSSAFGVGSVRAQDHQGSRMLHTHPYGDAASVTKAPNLPHPPPPQPQKFLPVLFHQPSSGHIRIMCGKASFLHRQACRRSKGPKEIFRIIDRGKCRALLNFTSSSRFLLLVVLGTNTQNFISFVCSVRGLKPSAVCVLCEH